MRLVVVGIPGSRRAELMLADARQWDDLELVEISWLDLLRGNADLRSVIRPGDVVRIDSPGRDFAVELELLRLGRKYIGDAAAASMATPSQEELSHLQFERGRILWPACWYAGFCRALRMIENQLAESSLHRCANSPADIAVMFDKTQTHQRLSQNRVAVAPVIGRIDSFVQLCDEAKKRRWSQVFVKLAHGSSASGAVAIRFGADRISAVTTVEIDNTGECEKLFNTRLVRKLETIAEIRAVVDKLCPHNVHAERWLPKAGINGRTFDLRVITIAGEVRHTVVRQSQSPMTNLHLLNKRGSTEAVRARCGSRIWQAIEQTCRDTAQAFSQSHCIGIDIMIENTFKHHAVLEVNAFGDLLPDFLHRGQTTYQAQLTDLFGLPNASRCLEIA